MKTAATISALCLLAPVATAFAVSGHHYAQHSLQTDSDATVERVYVVSHACMSTHASTRVVGVIGQEKYWLARGGDEARLVRGSECSDTITLGAVAADAQLLMIQGAISDATVDVCDQQLQWLARDLSPAGVEYTVSIAAQLAEINDGDCLMRLAGDQADVVSVSSEPIYPPASFSISSLNSDNSESTWERSEAIKNLVDSVGNSTARVRHYSTFLTGENPDSPIFTRQSYSDSGRVAAEWIRDTLSGLGFNASLVGYERRTGGRQWNPNVIAEWPAPNDGTGSDEIVIVGAHYDDRQYDSSSTTARAPGANDDGSGTTLVLQLAEWIATNQLRFRTRVILMAFSGEEQGLVGSRAWARRARLDKLPIRAMLQADMVGYNYRQGQELGVAFVEGYTTPSLTSRVRDWTSQYVPELVISRTNACCSDHQSFHESGFASAGFVEPKGYTVDPEYHHPGDLVDRPGYDLDQIVAISKAMLASLCELAELQA